jgi:hypothetical protein
MNPGHLSEMELQQYVLDRAACTSEAIGHVETCERCKAEVAIYQRLFAGIGDQPGAAFDFDLAAMVLSQLPAPTPVTVANRPFGWFGWTMTAVIGCVVCFSFYFFRKNIWNTFAGISGLFMYLILGAAAIVVALRILAMYKNYQQKIDSLNYY